ncbi:hypothetical protein FB45DRAFT_1141583 [Roridomyces roridus]|uniref:BTB domain-containing protein n=1 Tax=Roridomyces roridus TaxID=1738132 RepID=A0AAD7BYS5_9AGAR|nr:hypothetical protein FB45DRAFT_1141583 [Roridomyces roridus]
MSSPAPSPKRRRTDGPSGEELTPIRSHIWKPFGDIVLQVESTQFRVSRDVLATQSPVFADMFAVPQPPNEPTVEGCPVVTLSGDSAKDWELLLGVLYEPFKDKVARSFDEIAAMLRLGRKYEIHTAEANALERIRFEYPAEFNTWDDSSDSLTQIEEYEGLVFDLLSLAHEYGINSSVPTIAYEYVQDKIFTGIERPDKSLSTLSPELKQIMALGFLEFMKFQHNAYSLLEDDTLVPSRSCANKPKCAEARNVLRRLVAWNPHSAISTGCFALDRWGDYWFHGFCGGCTALCKSALNESRVDAWEALPRFFGLPEWAGLKDMD